MPVKVLIVDDMKNFLDLETSFLKRIDCTIFKALNGLEALRIAKDEKPDIVFLDLEMPVMNGIECCRLIRSDKQIKDTPIVIVTVSEKEQECYKAGCNSYLRKPINEDIFIAEIQKFVKVNVRKDQRVEISLPVNVTFKGTKTQGTALNISRSGLLLESREPFAIGTKITVDFSIPDSKQKIKVNSVVVRMIKGRTPEYSEFGLNFVKVNEKQQSLLDSFIKEKVQNR